MQVLDKQIINNAEISLLQFEDEYAVLVETESYQDFSYSRELEESLKLYQKLVNFRAN